MMRQSLPDSGCRISKNSRGFEANKMKGEKGGNCNRTACQSPGAYWYNHSTLKYYCERCARMLNNANHDDAQRLIGHDLCTYEGENHED